MISLSIGQKVALGLALPTTALLLYLLWRGNDDDDTINPDQVVTSRLTVIEMKVPRNVVGAVIGRQGAQIKEIQQETGARINFKDHGQDKAEEGPDRILVIRGNVETAQKAELWIRKIIVEQPDIVSIDIKVPQKTLGKIIGRGGESIRHMMRVTKCKINIYQSSGDGGPNAMTPITLKGSLEQIEQAQGMIEEKVAEFGQDRAKMAVSMAHRRERGRPRDGQPQVKADVAPPDQVCMPDHRDYLEVYVTAFEHPGQFWVQILTVSSARLDEIVQTMTSFYSGLDSMQYAKVVHFNVNDIVAAPFPYDESWYRARITKVMDDKVDLFYVDYGDSAAVHKEKIRSIRSDFLSIPFQAVECCMMGIHAKDGKWSEEGLDMFEDLTVPGKWKVLMARTKSYKETENGPIPCVQLVDTNAPQDVDIADKLVTAGFAEYDEIPSPSQTQPVENGVDVADGPRPAGDEDEDEGQYKDRIIVQQVMDFGRLEVES